MPWYIRLIATTRELSIFPKNDGFHTKTTFIKRNEPVHTANLRAHTHSKPTTCSTLTFLMNTRRDEVLVEHRKTFSHKMPENDI